MLCFVSNDQIPNVELLQVSMLFQAKYNEFYQNWTLIQYDGFVVLMKVEYSITMK